MTDIIVHTVGDSTLDNFYWVGKKEDSVEGQLEAKLGSEYEVVSHAYDGFTTKSVLEGDEVGGVLLPFPMNHYANYLRNRKINPLSPELSVHPLNALKASVAERPDATHYVVISVGGNDFRERLGTPWRLLTDIPEIHERYLRIVKEVVDLKAKNIRPILMFQYRLDANNDHYSIYKIMKVIGVIAMAVHLVAIAILAATGLLVAARKISPIWAAVTSLIGGSILLASHWSISLSVTKDVLFKFQEPGMTMLGSLMERYYAPILEEAKRQKLPILDLPNTFNPYDSLYVSGIEPSKKGGELIAEGLSHIIKNHNYESASSLLYAKSDSDTTFLAKENQESGNWHVRYPG